MKRLTQNKFLVLLVAILLVANLALMLYFFVFNKPKDEGRRLSPSEFMQKKIGFNEQQAAKFQQLRDQHKEAIKPVMEEMKKLKDSLYNLLKEPGSNDSTAITLTNKIGEKQKEWELMIYHHFQKVRAICDSSQLPKFDSLVHRIIKGPWMGKKRPAEKTK
jgi:flagellar basal body-associated protein FliL